VGTFHDPDVIWMSAYSPNSALILDQVVGWVVTPPGGVPKLFQPLCSPDSRYHHTSPDWVTKWSLRQSRGDSHVDENIASGEFCRDERYTRRGKKLHFTVVGCWAFDFYQLRSRIVHGQQVASAEMVYHGEITTMMVADIVFWECVKRLLFEHEFIGDAARACSKKLDEMSPESSAGSTLDHIAREMLGFNDVHRALGWVGPADGCS